MWGLLAKTKSPGRWFEDTCRGRGWACGFVRHDKKNGLRYAKPVDVTFENVKVNTGKKLE
jgi:hypothetical protein